MITSNLKSDTAALGVWLPYGEGDVHIHTDREAMVIGRHAKRSAVVLPEVALAVSVNGVRIQTGRTLGEVKHVEVPEELMACWLNELLCKAQGFIDNQSNALSEMPTAAPTEAPTAMC